jgi:DNA-binding transcriptional ArsR family regulator
MKLSVFVIFFITGLVYTSVFAGVATAQQESFSYSIKLGEYWPELKGYNFNFSIPEGYEFSNVDLHYDMLVVNLSGPPVYWIFDSQKIEEEPADFLSIEIFWLNPEEDFDFYEKRFWQISCAPSPSISDMSMRKTNGYDDYYIKSIGCYYCPEPEIEGWFFEALIQGFIFLNESFKHPVLHYDIFSYYHWLCELGEINPVEYLTIGDTPMNEKKSEIANHIFSSIQLTFSPPENESYIPIDQNIEIPVTDIVIITSAAAGTIALFGILATEWGRNKFYWFLLFLGPLYLRTVKEEVFDNQKRYCMYNHIAENQPVVYSDIKKTCNLSDGEINWHAHMMIQLDLIKKERKGFHLFFYLSKSPRLQPTEFIRLTDMQQAIFDLIVKNPGINQGEIVEKFGLKQQNISYNLLKLEEKGKINVEKKGTVKFYYPLEKDSNST